MSTWRAETPTFIEPLAFLRELDDEIVAHAIYAAERRELIDLMLAWLEAQPATPPGWISGRRLAEALRYRLAGNSLEKCASLLQRSTERAREMLSLAHHRLRSRFE
jgi:hypothetical protein